MSRSRLLAVFATLTSSALVLAPAATEASAAAEQTARYLVVRKADAGTTRGTVVADVVRAAGGVTVSSLPSVGAAVADLTSAQAARLDATPGLVVDLDGPTWLVEPSSVVASKPLGVALSASPRTSELAAAATAQSWGLDRIDQRARGLDGGYHRRPEVDGDAVHAFIIDTGVSTSHPEFSGRIGWGYSTVADGLGVEDCHGHGSHVAGTIGSKIFGVAPHTVIHPVRVLDCEGSGDFSDFIEALEVVAASAPASSVANASLGGGYNAAVNAAVDNFVALGTPLVAAAGNAADDVLRYSPASAESAVTVAASEKGDWDAPYSNYGEEIDVYAPGTDIWSTYYADPAYKLLLSGTSMAAPHVAGYLALHLEVNATATPSESRAALLAQATRDAIRVTYGGTPNLLTYSYSVAFPRAVTFRRAQRATKLFVDIDPGVGGGSWLVHIQRKSQDGFKTVRSVRTNGTAERVTVDVARGRYRAAIPRQFGYGKKVTGTVRIRR